MQKAQTGLWRFWAVLSALKAAIIINPPTGITCENISNAKHKRIIRKHLKNHLQTYNAL